MMTSASKIYVFVLLFASAYSFAIRQAVESGDTVLTLLEGNVTASQFDNDGTDFDIFSYLFTASSRSGRLEGDIPGDITVLAPDDNAFRRAVGDLGLGTSSELEIYENFLLYLMNAYLHPIDFLTRILYYHIVPGEVNSTAALQLPSLATWDEPSRITREGNALIDRNPELPNPRFDTERMDIQASNGIIHVIDYVLFPEVIRKLDISALESECSSPEASLEETIPHSDVGPLPVENSSDMTSMDETASETEDPSQVAERPTVTTLPLNLDVTVSPNTAQSEPFNSVTLPPFDDEPPQEDLMPSQELAMDQVMASQEAKMDFADGSNGNTEESSVSSSQQEPSVTEVPETEPSMIEELQGSAASPNPSSMNQPTFSQSTTSGDPSSVDTSLLDEEDNLIPQASMLTITQASPDIPAEEPFQSEAVASPAIESATVFLEMSPSIDASALPSPTCGSLSHPSA